MPVKLVLGLQHGDEGKGRVVDDLVQTWADIIVRFQGGGNAGHTVYDENNNKFVTHILPVGVLNQDKLNIVSKGCVVNLLELYQEIKELNVNSDNLKISGLCPIIEPVHILKDKLKYAGKIGTTAKGIGPAYSDFYARDSILFEDFVKNPVDACDRMTLKLYNYEMNMTITEISKKELDTAYARIDMLKSASKELSTTFKQYLLQDEFILQKSLDKNILLEGAQGSGLSINTNNYPNVTSSYPTVGGALNATNLNHKHIDEVIGVIKSYKTKVGSGSFPSLCDHASGKVLADLGKEYGATTGRPRQCGWLDMDEVIDAVNINGVDHICVVKTDVLSAVQNPFVYINGTRVKINKINNVDHENDNSFKELLQTIKIKTETKTISYTTGPKRGQIVWNAM